MRSSHQMPFVDRVPRPLRRVAGRSEAPLIPTYIRPWGIELDPARRAHIRRKLGMKLGKFAPSIERISVRVEDVNGPRGGVDQACRIKVVLSGLPSIVIERHGDSLPVAVDRALVAVERAVRRSVQRRRMNRRKGRVPPPTTPSTGARNVIP